MGRNLHSDLATDGANATLQVTDSGLHGCSHGQF
jgi:hypothetical protein